MPTDTSTPPISVQEAFTAAKEEHSTPVEQAPPPTEASTAPPTTEAPAQDTDTAAGAPPVTATPDLVSDADFAAIQAKFPNDPVKQRAELNKAFTQKTQALAPYRDFIQAYERDPRGAVEALATQHGLKLAPTAADQQITQTATTIADDMAAVVAQELGPDLAFMAEPVTRAMRAVAERAAKAAADQAVQPLKVQQDQLVTKAAAEQSAAVMKTFTEAHPDWAQHEPAMAALAQQITPKGMDDLAYLNLLYQHVTYDARVAADTKKAIERMTTGAKAARDGTAATSETKVQTTPPGKPTVLEAFQAAKRGETWGK